MSNTILPQSKPTALRLVVDNGQKHRPLNVPQSNSSPTLIGEMNDVMTSIRKVSSEPIRDEFMRCWIEMSHQVPCNNDFFGGAA